MKDPTRTVALFFSLAVGTAFLLLVAHRSSEERLSEEQVRRAEERLLELVRRTEVKSPGSAEALQLSYTFAPGGYLGLVVLGDAGSERGEERGESRLSFTVRCDAPPRSVGETGPSSASLALVRDPLRSDLVPRGHGRRLLASLRTVETPGPGPPWSRLTLANVLDRNELAAAVAVSRGLGILAERSNHDLRPRDLEVLARLIRGTRAWLAPEVPGTSDVAGEGAPEVGGTSWGRGVALTFFRDADPRDYGLRLQALGVEAGSARFRLRLEWDGMGSLREARLRLVPESSDLRLPATLHFRAPGSPNLAPLELAYLPLRAEGETGLDLARILEVEGPL